MSNFSTKNESHGLGWFGIDIKLPNYVFLLQVITRYVKMNPDHQRVLNRKGIFKYEINRILLMNTYLLPVLMAAGEVF